MSNKNGAGSPSIDGLADPRLGEAATSDAYSRAKAQHDRIQSAVGDLLATGKGVYLGFFPPPEVVKQVTLAGQISEVKPPHVTLCFLGKKLARDVVADVLGTAQRMASCVTAAGLPLRVTGSALFAGSRAHVLLVEGADAFQSVLASTLRARNLPMDATYSFTGHLTLAFENRGLSGFEASEQRRMLSEHAAAIAAEGVSWTATELVVAAGTARIAFPFAG